MVSPQALTQFTSQGYALAHGLFSSSEVSRYIEYFMDMVHRGGDGWAEGGVSPEDPDPLKRYPRLLQPHRGDRVAFDFMVDPRVNEWLTALLGESPLAVQTMVYFKAPGSKGQALHQDQRYLQVEPGTCVAAWLALDDCDEENGCLMVVPGSHDLPVLCPQVSDSEDSWSKDQVPIPSGLEAVPVVMKAGDVIFFNGQLIHGSHKNNSGRFRRIIVGHYIVAEAEKVSKYYFPVFRMDGSDVNDLTANEWQGGPCGVLRDQDGETLIDMVGTFDEAKAAH
jgi:phytanoyl-CoA hydroxylase